MSRILISIYLCLTILFGCGETKTERDIETQESRPSLVLGLIPERNIFKQLDRYEPLATYLSEKIGADVKLKVLTRYGNIIDNFASAGLDGAFFGSFTYTLAHAKLGVEAIASGKVSFAVGSNTLASGQARTDSPASRRGANGAGVSM